MSVIVISHQMLADVVKKAHTFCNKGNPHEEHMMCHMLGDWNKIDALYNHDEVTDFFFRLYLWNIRTYEKMYVGDFIATEDKLRAEFDKAVQNAKDIDIYQFQFILHFLECNIEPHEFENGYHTAEMKSDYDKLKDMRTEICKRIVTALAEERGAQYHYY